MSTSIFDKETSEGLENITLLVTLLPLAGGFLNEPIDVGRFVLEFADGFTARLDGTVTSIGCCALSIHRSKQSSAVENLFWLPKQPPYEKGRHFCMAVSKYHDSKLLLHGPGSLGNWQISEKNYKAFSQKSNE